MRPMQPLPQLLQPWARHLSLGRWSRVTTLKRARQSEEEEVTAADYSIEISGLSTLSSAVSKNDVAEFVTRVVTSSWAERRRALQRRRVRRWSFTRFFWGLLRGDCPCAEQSDGGEEAEPLVESHEWMLGVGEKCHRREAVTEREEAEQARRGLVSASPPTSVADARSSPDSPPPAPMRTDGSNYSKGGVGNAGFSLNLSGLQAETGAEPGASPGSKAGATAPLGLSETVLSVVHNVEMIAPDATSILRVDAEERRVRLRAAEVRACSTRARDGDPVAKAMLRLRSAAAWRPWRSAENLRWSTARDELLKNEAFDEEGFDEETYQRSVNRIKAGAHHGAQPTT